MPLPSSRVVAPGVYTQELDLSQYIRQLTDTILAVVTTASKGPLNDKTLCTTPEQLEAIFGPASESHPGLLIAKAFLQNGGAMVWVVRVASLQVAAASVAIDDIAGGDAFTLTANEKGGFFNGIDAVVSHANQESASETDDWDVTTAGPDALSTTLTNLPIVPGTLQIKEGSTLVAKDDGNGALVFESGYSEFSAGTVNYLTGAVAATATAHGSDETLSLTFSFSHFTTFTLQLMLSVKNSNGDLVKYKPLETFYGLTLDTIEDEIANHSRYLAALSGTPTVFPKAGTYTLTGGDDGLTGILDTDFIGDKLGGVRTGLQIFGANVDINEVLIPGRSSAAIKQALVQLAEERQDIMVAALDPPSGLTPEEVVDWANATGAYTSHGVVETNRGAIYYPHISVIDQNTGDTILAPPSHAIAEALGRSAYWEAPAGPDKGLLKNCVGVEYDLEVGERQYLGANRINPIGDLNGLGIQILGQYTATRVASQLDRVAPRRTLLRIETAIAKSVYPFLFKPHSQELYDSIEGLVNPYLRTMAATDRIEEGRFYCNDKTNGVEQKQNRTLSCVCVLKLLSYAEKILVTFQIVDYGVEITEDVISQNIVGL